MLFFIHFQVSGYSRLLDNDAHFYLFCVGKCANVGGMSEDGIRCLHLLPTLPSHLRQALSLNERIVAFSARLEARKAL